jgi:hypothetical protein
MRCELEVVREIEQGRISRAKGTLGEHLENYFLASAADREGV